MLLGQTVDYQRTSSLRRCDDVGRRKKAIGVSGWGNDRLIPKYFDNEEGFNAVHEAGDGSFPKR
jgi:hypothetical protein